MKDGYYLAVYLHIDPVDALLDVIVRHDQNMALFRKQGSALTLVNYWELERFSGRKAHSPSFSCTEKAVAAIHELLEPLGLTLGDMVEVWGTPGLQTVDDYHSLSEFPELSYHSVSHLFSSIMMNTEIFYGETILALAVDGGPDGVVDVMERRTKPYYVGAVVREGHIRAFPVESPGVLWGWAMYYFKLREGTLMALASASTSEFWGEPADIPPLYDGSGYFDKENYFEILYERIDKLTELEAGRLFSGFDPRFTVRENKISMLMKVIQKVSYAIMERNIDRMLSTYGVNAETAYLSMSGGFALNCPTNRHLMHKYRFKGFVAPPCVGDSGLSLGMGLYAFYKKTADTRLQFELKHAFYGVSDDRLEAVLRSGRFAPFIQQATPFQAAQAAEDMMAEPIVWFQGEAEIGPRALGHRSILGDPRQQRAKDEMNRIKQREWWRPVAPIVLADRADAWFEDAYASPFMLHTFSIKSDKLESLPAVAHLDGTARVQTLDAADPSPLLALLQAFYERTGVPIIANSSLNDKGEPIINTVEGAIDFALKKGMRFVYIHGVRLEMQHHDRYAAGSVQTRTLPLERGSPEEQEALWSRLNPHCIPIGVLEIFRDPIRMRLLEQYDITVKEDAERLQRDVKLLLRKSKYAKREAKP